jgi:hypothetical protein
MTTQTAGVSGTAALALTRMNEDFLNLDYSALHLLMVACINEYDPTRLQHLDAQGNPVTNPWLNNVCNQMKNINVISDLATKAANLAEKAGLKPIDPTLPLAAAQKQAQQAPVKSTIKRKPPPKILRRRFRQHRPSRRTRERPSCCVKVRRFRRIEIAEPECED